MRYYNTDAQEQETSINIDYFEKKLDIYTSRKKQIETFRKVLGEPKKIYTLKKGQVSGCLWSIPFKDTKRTSKALSRPLLIGSLSRE